MQPYRTQLKTAGPNEIEAARASGLLIAPVDDEARAIVTQGHLLSSDRLDAIARHPDESIPALYLMAYGSKLTVEARLPFYYRAAADARRDGHFWTPLLDVMATSESWPGAGSLRLPGGPAAPADVDRPSAWLDQLTTWVAEQTDAKALAPLLSFRHAGVRERLAEAARVLTREQVADLSATSTLRACLASNVPIAAVHHPALYRQALAGLMHSDSMYRRSAAEIITTLNKSLGAMPPDVVAVLSDMLERDDPGAREAWGLLLKSADTPEPVLLRMAQGCDHAAVMNVLDHPSSTSKVEVYVASHAPAGIAKQLLRRERLCEEARTILYERFSAYKDVLQALIEAPHTPLTLLRRVAGEVGAFEIRWLLAQSARARRDDVICGQLLRSTSLDLLESIAADVHLSADRFAEIFERLAGERPDDAARLLAKRLRHAPVTLRPTALLPLLSAKSRRTREIALLALGDSRPHELLEYLPAAASGSRRGMRR